MKKVILSLSLLSISIISPFAKASSDTSLGVIITEVKLKTILSENGFLLSMSYDENKSNYILSGIKIFWRGKDIDIKKNAFPPVIAPSLSNARINGVENSDNTLILIIPFNLTRTENAENTLSQSHDATRIVFNNGEIITYSTAVALNKERTRWQLSKLNSDNNKLEPYSIVDSNKNPLFE